MELSMKTENALMLLSVGAVDFGGNVSSTCMDKVKPSDVSAAIGGIEDVRWRSALLLAGGFHDDVNMGLFKQSIIAALTLVNPKYVKLIGSNAKADKLFAAIDCAVDQLMGFVHSRDFKCFRIGVKKDAYHCNWQLVELDAATIVHEWMLAGESELHRQLYSERQSA